MALSRVCDPTHHVIWKLFIVIYSRSWIQNSVSSQERNDSCINIVFLKTFVWNMVRKDNRPAMKYRVIQSMTFNVLHARKWLHFINFFIVDIKGIKLYKLMLYAPGSSNSAISMKIWLNIDNVFCNDLHSTLITPQAGESTQNHYILVKLCKFWSQSFTFRRLFFHLVLLVRYRIVLYQLLLSTFSRVLSVLRHFSFQIIQDSENLKKRPGKKYYH